MNPNNVKRENLRKLTDLPNIGKAGAKDLNLLGIHQSEQLVGKCPYDMYYSLCFATGKRHDPCVIDVFISITRFMNGENPLPWWEYTQERKNYLTKEIKMKFGYTIVYVSSVPSTLNFYKKAFGFETRFLHESEQYGELSTGETVLAFASHVVGEVNIVEGYQKTKSGALPLGIELAFVTENVLAAYSKAISAGATSISEPCEKPWGQTVAYVRDSDGVIVELCSPM